MTEPEVSGSDPTTLRTQAVLEGGEWVINGHKWFTSGAVGAVRRDRDVRHRARRPPYARASMIRVPTDAPGFNLVRPVPVMGHDGGPGHCEIRYEDCRVPEQVGLRHAAVLVADLAVARPAVMAHHGHRADEVEARRVDGHEDHAARA